MSESNKPFIGDGTLLEALLNEYTKQFKEYSGNEIRVTLTSKQRSELKEISNAISDEFSAMAFGIEAVGRLVKIANYENKEIDNQQLEQLGWLLEYFGKSFSSHWNLMECLAEDLARSSVTY